MITLKLIFPFFLFFFTFYLIKITKSNRFVINEIERILIGTEDSQRKSMKLPVLEIKNYFSNITAGYRALF